MKKKQLFFILLFALAKLLSQKTLAQIESNYGNWFYSSSTGNAVNIFPKSHFGPPTVFPGTGVQGDNIKMNFSTKEKNKFQKIIEALKEANPKPKYHSMLYWMYPQTPNGWRKLTPAMIAKRQFRFSYFIGLQYQYMALENNKPVANINALKFGREWDFLNININTMPDFLGGKAGDFDNRYDGPRFVPENDFAFKKYNGDRSLPTGGDEREKFPRYPSNDRVLSIENRYDAFEGAAKYLSKAEGFVPFEFGNEADKHFVYRSFNSSRLGHSGTHQIYGKVKEKDLAYDKYNRHVVNNMVILSHNNQLPFKPISIGRFLEMGDDIVDESIEHYNNETNLRADIKQENLDKLQRTKAFIQSLREKYAGRLQEHAIIDARYSHITDFSWWHILNNNRNKTEEILNRISGKREAVSQVLGNFFTTDTKNGKAFYTYDKDFYKNMADGEIRTICVIWKDYIRVPDHKDFGKGFQIENGEVIQNRFSDNPDQYLYHFNKKFDWKKLEAVLGK